MFVLPFAFSCAFLRQERPVDAWISGNRRPSCASSFARLAGTLGLQPLGWYFAGRCLQVRGAGSDELGSAADFVAGLLFGEFGRAGVVTQFAVRFKVG